MQVAKMYRVDIPNCRKVINWYNNIKDPNFGEFSFNGYGIRTKEEFEKFYEE